MNFQARLADVGPGRVFACETRTGFKFGTATLEECWAEMQTNKHLHETIRPDAPCHLYFDLDGPREDVAGAVRYLREHVSYICETKYGPTEIVVLTSHGAKGSAHLIVRPHAFRDNQQCRVWVERLRYYLEQTDAFDERLWATIDESVYRRNKNFRMLGMTKRGEDRPFGGVPFSYKNWLKSLVQATTYTHLIDLGAKRGGNKGPVPAAFAPVREWFALRGHIISVWSPPLANWIVTVSFRRMKCPYHGAVHRSNHNYIVTNLRTQKFQVRCMDANCKGKWENKWACLPPVLRHTRTEYLKKVNKTYTI